MNATNLAVLMACHNRKDKTLRCLDKLVSQEQVNDVNLQFYLVDAGSTDGTGDVVQERFPNVILLRRDASLYWCGGMRVAFEEAMNEDFDFYLWLNDDTMLTSRAVRTLLDTAHQTRAWDGRAGIVVGSTLDPETGVCTYGGVVRRSRWRPMALRLCEPSDKPKRCDTMNGNCVLISREVALSVGNLSPEFTHAIGDRDYGLRARAKGFSLWIAPGYVGQCPRNPPTPWSNPAVPLRDRLKVLRSSKGLPPHEYMVYTKRHAGGYWWPVYYWLTLYLKVLAPSFWKLFGR